MPDEQFHILLIEDNPAVAAYYQTVLSVYPNRAFNVECTGTLQTGLERLVTTNIDVILLDLFLSDSQGFDSFLTMHTTMPEVPIVILATPEEEELAVRAVQQGAEDYLIKGKIDSRLLVRVIWYVANRRQLKQAMEKQTEKLQASEAQFRNIITHNADGLIVVDAKGVVRFINPAGEALFDRHAKELVESNFGFPLVKGETTELDIVRRGGETVTAEMRVVNTIWEDEIAYLACLRDITERKQAEAKLRHARQLEHYLAYHDSLTGLPNRQLFYDRLHQTIVQIKRSAKLAALLFLDLDGFKRVNDTLGHSTGDLLLQNVAQRLQSCIRENGIVTRLGSDEFIIILHEIADHSETFKVAQKIREVLSKPFVSAGHELFATASIGISLCSSATTDAETLVRNANTAMYRAKRLGKNNYQLYEPSMVAKDHEYLKMENCLRRALDRDKLTVYYQPQIALDTGELTGVEALVRWHHPEFGFIPPGRFIPMAEETGLISAIDQWVLRTACRHSISWQNAGLPPVRMAINLSAHGFRQNALPDTVAKVLSETGFPPDYLELEITESSAMEDVNHTIETLHILKEMGVRLSVDDFGTGHSSLSYLKSFPVDRLKIDRSFVRGIPEDNDDVSITSAIVALAHSLDLEVVAEGVETEEQFTFLQSLKCGEAQGFFWDRPLPIEVLSERLKASTSRPHVAA